MTTSEAEVDLAHATEVLTSKIRELLALREAPESERMESYRALADDPAVEGISHEVLDELLADPDFGTKMAAARATVDAEIEAALAEDVSDS
jgi:hypothetical protein